VLLPQDVDPSLIGYGRVTLVPSPLVVIVKVPAEAFGV